MIRTAAPAWRVLDSPPAAVDRVDGILAYVVGVDLAPGPAAGLRLATLRVVVLTGQTDVARADDHLDLELEKLLEVLDGHAGVQSWKATRDVFGTDPGWHGYGVEFDLLTNKIGA